MFSNLPFEIGPGFKISVKGYNILQAQKPARSTYIWLNGEKAQIAVGQTTQIAEDSARTVEKTELRKAYKFGGEHIIFTKEEQAKLKDFGEPGLRIIGFKPQSMLPMWASVNKSIFIYPSEEDYVGSTRVFAALWQKLLKDKKMGVAWFIARKNARPQIVALLPSAERLDEATNQQVTPAGLWVYPIPYADDIRYPPETPEPLVSPDKLVDTMRIVIQQLQLPGGRFDPAKYPNPSLQWHYRILQAMALEEEIPEFEAGDDKTVPKYRQIDKRVGSYVVEWGIALEEQYQAWAREKGTKSSGPSLKRGATDVKQENAKRVKKEDGKPATGQTKIGSAKSVDGMSTEELKKKIKAGRLGSSTVAELKDWLSTNGHSIAGKKQDLVTRIEELLE